MSPTQIVQRIKAWSYSRYTDYKKCPYLLKLKAIERKREPENEPMLRGQLVHAEAETFVTGKLPGNYRELKPDAKKAVEEIVKTKKVPKSLETFKQEFVQIKKAKTQVEHNWGFTREWKPCPWDAWDICWLRIKIDSFTLEGKSADVRDYKTGRPREEHEEQRSLYALGIFLMYPDIETVTARHWYVDQGVEEKNEYKRSELPKMQKAWEKKTKAMLTDTSFVARPGSYCGYCFFRKANGGPCKY